MPAVSLIRRSRPTSEPANITPVANDVGTELIFVRQSIAHAQPGDTAIAISTSGGSPNLIVAPKRRANGNC